MNSEATNRLALLAVQIAIEAPIKFSEHGYLTSVRRSAINEIRSELEKAGVDWRKTAKVYRARRAALAKAGAA